MTALDIDPISNTPSANLTSVPLIRGDPSRRSVAIVRCLRDTMSARTRDANSGSDAWNSAQLATAMKIIRKNLMTKLGR